MVKKIDDMGKEEIRARMELTKLSIRGALGGIFSVFVIMFYTVVNSREKLQILKDKVPLNEYLEAWMFYSILIIVLLLFICGLAWVAILPGKKRMVELSQKLDILIEDGPPKKKE